MSLEFRGEVQGGDMDLGKISICLVFKMWKPDEII